MEHRILPREMTQHKRLKNLTSSLNVERKKGDAMEIGEDRDMLRKKPKALHQRFN